MNAVVTLMPSEIEELKNHFDRRIEETILPRMDRLEAKVDEVFDQARRTNGRVTDLEKWKERIAGSLAALGGSWHVLMAVGGITVAIVSVVLANT